MIKVHPTSENISYLYPNNNLLPSDTQYLPDRIIRFTRTYEEDGTTKTENIDYELPDDLLRYSSEVYDEFYLNYESQTCQVIKRCAYNADGTVRALGTEITTDYEYPTITLGEGNYTITLLGYDFGYIYARLMAKNIYTTQFYTKVETDSRINQKADEINLGVSQTLTNYSTTNEMNSAITLKANEITSTVSNNYETKNSAQSNYSQLQQTANNISSVVSKKVGEDEIISKINQSAEQVSIKANKISLNGKTLNLADNMAIVSNNFNVDSNGNMTCSNANFKGGNITLQGAENKFNAKSPVDKNIYTSIYTTDRSAFINIRATSQNRIGLSAGTSDGGYSTLTVEGPNSNIICWDGTVSAMRVEQVSKETQKKNIKKFTKGLDIINQIDIYEFNYKNEKNEDKKHIGFIIGDNYNYSKRATNNNNNSVDLEQQEEIEELKKEIEKLKGGK